MDYPFGRNWDGYSNNSERADQVFITTRLANTRRRATRLKQLMISVWAGPRYNLKSDISERMGDIVVVKLMH